MPLDRGLTGQLSGLNNKEELGIILLAADGLSARSSASYRFISQG
jgi:hypothetical protein